MNEDKKETPQSEESEEVSKQAEPVEAEVVEPEKKVEKKDRKKDKKKEADKSEELEKQLAAANDKYLRICAEYDNYRRRSQKEKDALYGDIKADTVQKFLPVYDNLERALKQGTEDEAYRKGVEMIMTQFNSTLEKLGVTAIESLGQTFDPSLHNAVMHVDDDQYGDNEIVEVFQKGYKLGDRILRHAMVKVAN